jgi:hypothetical protein
VKSTLPKYSPSSRNIGVAAEAVAALQFARCGFDVSVQYGVNQPEYDLIVAKDARLLKVSVKGSQDGSWGLTQSFLKQADYHAAIQKWFEHHGARTALCLVQFKNVALSELPRIYLGNSRGDCTTATRDRQRTWGQYSVREPHLGAASDWLWNCGTDTRCMAVLRCTGG